MESVGVKVEKKRRNLSKKFGNFERICKKMKKRE